jgi:hypothetical protein
MEKEGEAMLCMGLLHLRRVLCMLVLIGEGGGLEVEVVGSEPEESLRNVESTNTNVHL